MEKQLKIKQLIFDATAMAFILLFCYAATSKLTDFQNFQVQLAQSPMLSAFSKILSFTVPISEFLIAGLLIIKRYRLVALILSYWMMILFTSYIFIILNYSSYVPCSCGGVLEKLGWEEHLAFNIFFIVLAAVAIAINTYADSIPSKNFARNRILLLVFLAVAGYLFMSLLFDLSEKKMRFHNNLTRRFPPHMADQLNSMDLKFNSYYFAGHGNGKIYLGNTTAPFTVTVLDSALTQIETFKIDIDRPLRRMNQPLLQVAPPYFYFYEGASPYIYSGSITDWKAKLGSSTGLFFSQLVAVGKNKIAVRYNNPVTAENVIGWVDLSDTLNNSTSKNVLQKQGDGTFDTDGMLLGDIENGRIHYIYYYRNSFITAKEGLDNAIIGKTIDTVANQELHLVSLKTKKAKTFSQVPLVVNRAAASDAGWLFINSEIMGQLDREEMWKVSSIIDIYEIDSGAYLASFYIDNDSKKKIRSFIVAGNNIYAMGETKVVRYKLRRFLGYPRK